MTPTLDYRPAADDRRPAWATRLGTASVVLGTFGLFAGATRMRDAHMYVFDPTFRWLVAPPAWVPPTYFGLISVAIAVSALLLAAGVATLVMPATGRRLLLAYAWAKLPLVALTAACRARLIASAPSATMSTWLTEAAIECLLFTAYPILVLTVLRRTR